MAEVRNIKGELLEQWERSVTPDGVPYYINHSDEHTRWDHPVVETLIEEFVSFDTIKYAAYRTALKIKKIQQTLNLESFTLPIIANSFDNCNWLSSNNQETISCRQLESLLEDVYMIAQLEARSTIIAHYSSLPELLSNVLMDICDFCREDGCIPVVNLKVYLCVFCAGRLPDKYKYMFRLFCNKDGYMCEKSLMKLFGILSQIPEFLSEKNSFGRKLVPGAVKSCLKNFPSGSLISQDMFLEWLLQEPQNLVWLSTVTRLTAAERVHHSVKCAICKRYPIIGFRYSCLKCFKYDQCQQCFFVGFQNKKHKVRHPMQEYCRVASPREETKAFLKIIENRLKRRSSASNKQRYLPINPSNDEMKIRDSVIVNRHFKPAANDDAALPEKASNILQTDDYLWEGSRVIVQPEHRNSDESDCFHSSSSELESIIIHIENENRHLLKEVEQLNRLSIVSSRSSTSSDASFDEIKYRQRMAAQNEMIHEHNQQIDTQLQRLKMFIKKQKVKDEQSDQVMDRCQQHSKEQLQSTPTANEPQPSFENLSPIEMLQNSNCPSLVSKNDDILSARQTNVRSSLRRKVLQPKQSHYCDVTPQQAAQTVLNNLDSNKSSSYGFDDLTSIGSFDKLSNTKQFTLPHPKDIVTRVDDSADDVQNQLQDIIDQLENIAPSVKRVEALICS